MAEAAVFGIAKSVLQQLGSPALDEFRLLWGYKDHLDKLKDTITTINNVLEDADRKQATNRAVQGWLGRLRVVLYEAEDLFDAISAKAFLKKGTKIREKVRHFVSKPYRFASLVKTAHKVKEIRERFDDIARDINGFNFLQNQTDEDAISRIRREETHSFVPRNEVVGREQETEDVVSLLLSDSYQERRGVSVIAVIGIGGLGKTTLAQLVYNDGRVQKGFDLCMWACINDFSDLKQVLITLLKPATTTQLEDLTLDQLQSLFRKEIEEKSFLLVLDDVWDEDHQNWRKLKHLLSSGKHGSKVLSTTRSEIVAQSLCAIKPYFHLKGISDESAWLLFKKEAFGEEGDQNSSEFEELGRQIVRKCANVPLAIVTIASLLREKEKEKWFPLVNDELSKVIPDEYEKIIHVLEFSYKELPYQVKRCFGYCSLFPKDYEFNKDRLVGLWIAQGFVEPLGNESLEDRAEEYLLYLVKRCFFQLATCDKEKRSTVTYQMHDLMHDLAMEVARSECILVDQIDEGSWDKTAQGSWDRTIRHVSINYEWESMVDYVCSFSRSKNLRTFLRPCRGFLEENALKKLISSFKSLRVLDLSRIGDFLMIWEVPTSIGELIHLRFLDLSRNFLERLPSSIYTLPHLQYLILRECVYLKELPEKLGDLLSLRLLDLSNSCDLERLPRAIGRLHHLQSLLLLECRCLRELPEELGDLLSLRLLDLSECYSLERLPRSICSLHHLQSLILRNCKLLKELPDDLGDLLSLRLLDLSACYSMERLPSSICSLHHLQSLILRECIALKMLPEELGDLVSLRHLVLQGCDSLVEMPIGLAASKSLVTLDILIVCDPSGGLKYLGGLTSLKQLILWECKELYLSWRALLSLPHLQKVWIIDAEKVIDVDSDPMMIQTQPISRSIRQLSIEDCSGEWVHDVPWKSLPFLVVLSLYRISNLQALPEGIQHLAALESLFIYDAPSLVLLPYWMSSLSSLDILRIEDGGKGLEERCKRLTGEDWPHIQHIPHISIIHYCDSSGDLSSEQTSPLARSNRFNIMPFLGR